MNFDFAENGAADAIYTLPQIKEKLAPVFRANNIKRAVLFGSYAKGGACGKSDVDIMVESGPRGLAFVGFWGEIREALEKDVDLIDARQIEAGSAIEDEIKRTGTVVYEE